MSEEDYGFHPVSEGTDDSEQKSALLKWLLDYAEAQIASGSGREIWSVILHTAPDELAERYFPDGIFTADFWALANRLSDDEFYPFVTSAFEDARLLKSPACPDVVYGGVSYERLRFVLMNYYYDIDAGAPFLARAHYDGAYSDELAVNFARALEILFRYIEITESTTSEFERLFSALGDDESADLLARFIKDENTGAFLYFAEAHTSDIEERVKKKAIGKFEEYGLAKLRESFDGGFIIDTRGNLFRYLGHDSEIKVPGGVAFIAAYAFRSAADTVTLPQSVVEIGDFALSGFKNIYFSSDIEKIGYEAFGGDPDTTVFAPAGAHNVAEYCMDQDITFVICE